MGRIATVAGFVGCGSTRTVFQKHALLSIAISMAQCSSHQKLHRSLIAGLSWKEEVEALSKQPLAAMHIPDALSYNRDQFHRIG